jgi:hypothetical protein
MGVSIFKHSPYKPFSMLVYNLLKSYIYFSYLVNYKFRYQRNTHNLKKMQNYFHDKEALIISNGASLNKVDFKKLKGSLITDKVVVFTLNFGILDERVMSLMPKYHVLSDPSIILNSSDANILQLNALLEKHPSISLITPSTWHGISYFCDANCIHFNDFDNHKFTFRTSTNPIKPRNYQSMTSLKTLALANYLGFKKIYIIGIDNSNILGLNVDINNQIFEKPLYGVSAYNTSPPVNLSKMYPGTSISDIAYTSGEIFWQLREYFGHLNILNLDPDSLVDCFPKTDEFVLENLK